MASTPKPPVTLCLVVFLLVHDAASGQRHRPPHPSRCSRFPMDTTRDPSYGDNNFEIRVSDGPYRMITRFVPGKTYQVTILNRLPAVSFINFYLTTKVEKKRMRKMRLLKPGPDGGRGRFVPLGNPATTTLLKNCSGVVTATSMNLEEVKLRWTAPTLPQGCVHFLATVIKYRGHYFKDQDRLNKRICPTYMMANDEANREQMLSDRPPSRSPCCACGTATYKLEFRGLWIRQLHPRDWPEPDGAVHWTNIIGASHDEQYSIYSVGRKASHGVSDVCERGDTSTLESDFKEGAERILNIIKTRGIMGGKHMSESRTAIFSVNRTHHLMSMLTMLGPSPDWCAGISSFDLCHYNCTWTRQRVVRLYPWDAGILKGNRYQHTQIRETPPHAIRNITKNWPQGNPFSIESDGRIRPVAEVTITRLSPKKDYECKRNSLPGVMVVSAEQNDEKDPYTRRGKSSRSRQRDPVKELAPNLRQMIPNMCYLTQWSDWSQCSVTCGTGSHTRQRRITRNLKPSLCTHVMLQNKRPCTGARRTCDYSKPCSVSAWSQWGPCNGSCNKKGNEERKRVFIRASEVERCSKIVSLNETRPCTLQCDDTITCSRPVLSGAQCYKPETRYYYDMVRRICLPFKYLGCKGSRNRFRTKQQCGQTCGRAFDTMPRWQVRRLAQQQKLDSQKARLRQKGRTERSCKEPMDLGHRCRHKKRVLFPSNRWYFNMKSRKCQEMVFKGCSGNKNNFLTEGDCKLTCAKLLAEASRRFNGPPQDCVVGSWGPWGPCSSKCMGRRMRKRKIRRAPMNGGRRCPARFSYERCQWKKCSSPCKYTTWSPWSACTVTCGSGWQERTRRKLSKSDNCRVTTPEFTDRVVCTRKKCPKRKNFYLI